MAPEVSGHGRRLQLARRALVGIACTALAWALLLYTVGGIDTTVAGLRVRSNNPTRVLLLSAIAAALFFAIGGRIRVPWRAGYETARRATAALVARPGWIAAVLAAATFAVSVACSTRAAGGSDVYGYMSQADLWLDGRLKVPVPWAREVPWPDKVAPFAPLGYRTAPGVDELAIVSTYSPGLPMLLAVAKLVAGPCALFAVVPLCGAIGVFATYAIGRRLASAATGLVGAAFVATSPASLGVMMDPLSDVPAMAVWALAFLCLLGRSWRAAAGAGLLASLAILIRPNLVVLAAPMALWYFVRRRPAGGGWGPRLADAAVFSLGVLPAVATIAWLNDYLYGAPLASGYGQLGDLLSWSRIVPNLVTYLRWYAEAETPVALLGLLAVAVPVRWLWPAAADRSIFLVVGLFVAVLWIQYAAYFAFDSWGYLRFLLPSWPFLMLGAAAALVAASRLAGRFGAVIVAAATIGIGAQHLVFAKEHGVFDQRQAARHTIITGPMIRQLTADNSLVIALQHSGSVRYYAGRVTARYDALPPATLDRDVAWLNERGVRVFAFLDEREAAEFKNRFAGQAVLSALDRPVLTYRPGDLFLFELTPATGPPPTPVVVTSVPPETFDCVPPEPLPQLVLQKGR
jgi:hypothetical protein